MYSICSAVWPLDGLVNTQAPQRDIAANFLFDPSIISDQALEVGGRVGLRTSRGNYPSVEVKCSPTGTGWTFLVIGPPNASRGGEQPVLRASMSNEAWKNKTVKTYDVRVALAEAMHRWMNGTGLPMVSVTALRYGMNRPS